MGWNKGTSPVPLSPMVRDIIAKVPVIDANSPADYVFSVNGRTPFDGWSKAKARLDRKMALKSRGSCATCAGRHAP